VVIGAGVVGAACAFYAARAGLSVAVVDRGPVAGGTTGAGEGNLLLSDKAPGPELELAQLSLRLWRELADEVGEVGEEFAGEAGDGFGAGSASSGASFAASSGASFGAGFEYEAKGGLVVAADPAGLRALAAFAAEQRAAGVTAHEVGADQLGEYEPHLAPGLAGGFHYPEDAQVQPALAAARLLRGAVRAGAAVYLGERVTALLTGPGGAVRGVRTERRELAAGAVVNAAGTWGGQVAQLAGVDLPVLPRRGFVLVTEPLPRVVRHKVYAADYVADVASGSAALQSSAVVEGTPAGTVLIGASRERVGFDRTVSVPALGRLARQAAALFPFLADVQVLRAYRGFRPYLPDHLPAIGADPRVPGLVQACGHEGAGIGLAPATGLLIAEQLTGQRLTTAAPVDLAPFRPDRFARP
jgi:glycine/D-amino acid oxidase-like deaminating enzyme